MNRKRQMEGTRRAATRLRLTGMIICTLALALIPAAAMADVQEGLAAPIIVTATPVVVNNGPGNQIDPHVDGNLVSYTSAANGVSEIRYFNFATSVDLGIAGAPGALDFISDVSGATVVFTRIEGAKQSIWSFNTTTNGPAIELDPSATSLRRGASIGGNTVAWQELGFSTSTSVVSEVMAYDLTTSTALRLTNDTQIDNVISVAPNGNVLVWDKCPTSSSPCDIWQATKGVGGWTVSQVTSTVDSETFPDTNGTLVVYGGVRAASATSADIYWKPVAGGAESQLALVGEQRNPNISGNVIAFEGRDLADASPNWDIYLYDLSTSTLYRLTNTPTLHETLNDISVVGTQVRVVWSVFETDNYNVYSTTFAFPVANAGSGQAVHSGNIVTLDGSASSDPDLNYPLSYSWTITSKPDGSAATLSDPAVVNPSFTADLPGDYVIRLVVADSSGFVSVAGSVTISTTNTAPVANAGADQTPYVNDTVTLNGSGSYDVDGNLLTYSWAFTSKPADSTATLSNNTTFTVDKAGTYVISLIVNDGTVDSQPDTVTISTLNSAPVANAGADQSAYVNNTVTLDGSGSTDVDGNLLTYRWAFTSKPDGSTAGLSDAASVNPTFTITIDKAGTYVVSLIVNDGTVDSQPDTVTISTLNSAPVANAGPDQSITIIGTTVQIDGTQSYDPDGDSITYQWTFASIPAGSTASISNADTSMPTFVADVRGEYLVQLVVNDASMLSSHDTVTISFTNIKPVADAGTSQSVNIGNTVTLDGSGSSDANGDTLTYSWTLTTVPTGSLSAITNPTAKVTTFVPDVAGTYVMQLIVNDGTVDSDPSTVQIQAVDTLTAAIQAVQDCEAEITSLDSSVFKNANMQNTLINKLNAVIANIEAGNYADALGQLLNDILGKTDGCANSGSPDKNDWIKSCEAQSVVYKSIQYAISVVEGLMP